MEPSDPAPDWSNEVCSLLLLRLFTSEWTIAIFLVCLLHVLMLNEKIRKLSVLVSFSVQLSLLVLVPGFLLPDDLAPLSLLFAWVSVAVLEWLRGVKLDVRDDFSFASDLPSKYFRDCDLVKATASESGTLRTELKCLVPSRRKHSLPKGPLPLDQICRVYSEVNDRSLISSLERMEFDLDSCFQLTANVESSQVSLDIVLVTGSQELRGCWVNILKKWVGFTEEEVYKIWLRDLLCLGEEEASDRLFTIDDALALTNQVGRNFNPTYLLHLFESFGQSDGRSLKLRQSISTFRNRIRKEGSRIESKVELRWSKFFAFSRAVVTPVSIETVFKRVPGRRKTSNTLPSKAFQKFLLEVQREYQLADEYLEVIRRIEPVLLYSNVSVIGFSNYLFMEDQSILNVQSMDSMDEPLSHYYIASSHNTYLTKDQLKSKSSVGMYVKAMKRGCKCVELDCWDGSDNEPVIYHGFTLTSKILFKEVVQAVKDHAFVRSPYPVILSLEIHCSIEQQKVMVKHLKEILGDALYLRPIHADEYLLPSPNDLRGHVIIKSKKIVDGQDDGFIEELEGDLSDEDLEEFTETSIMRELGRDQKELELSDIVSLCSLSDDEETGQKDGKRSSLQALLSDVAAVNNSNKAKNKKGTKLAKELSDLVIYCQAKRFKSFESSKIEDGHFEMCSLQEKKALRLAKESGRSFVGHTVRHLVRVYPSGHRIDSSNYNPVHFWNVGCQMVALNYQTPCKAMQLNQALFQLNSRCGYVLKPKFLREEGSTFDPQSIPESYMTLSIRIISGHQMPFKLTSWARSERNYVVQTRIFGVEEDCQSQQTSPARNNGLDPSWDEVFLFKIHVPELAMLMLSVYAKAFVAQYSLPVRSLRRGCRKVPLLDKHSETIKESFLLVHVEHM